MTNKSIVSLKNFAQTAKMIVLFVELPLHTLCKHYVKIMQWIIVCNDLANFDLEIFWAFREGLDDENTKNCDLIFSYTLFWAVKHLVSFVFLLVGAQKRWYQKRNRYLCLYYTLQKDGGKYTLQKDGRYLHELKSQCRYYQ